MDDDEVAMMTLILHAVAASFSLVVAAFFFRFWRDMRDRFFLLFGSAFAVLSLQWALLATIHPDENRPAHYALRVGAFALIIAAIVDKNRR